MTPKQWKRLFARTLLLSGLLVASVLLVLFAISTWKLHEKEGAASAEHKDQTQALQDLKDRKTELSQSLARLETDRGIEEEVRKRFPVARPGEEEILLVNPKDTAPTTTEKKGFWATITSWFSW